MDTKLRELLLLMEEQGLDVLLLHNADEYQSGCICSSRSRVEWLCGFTGSNAFLIVCKKGKSQFFTDSRYVIQSALEVDQTSYDIHDFSDLTPLAWLDKNIDKRAVVGYEGELFTPSQIEQYAKFQPKLIPYIMLDKLWKRSMKINQRVQEHPVEFTGLSSREKRLSISSALPARGAMLMTDVDAISWLLNIRNVKFTHTPSVLSRAILHCDGSVELFVDGADEVRLDDADVRIFAMDELHSVLKSLHNIVVDASTIPMSLFNMVRSRVIDVRDCDPCTLPKATKNEAEIQGMIQAHVRDGAAMANFLYWLYSEFANHRTVTELEAASKVREFRSAHELFMGESFDTISGFGSNGAIVHYRASEKTNRVLEEGGLYLLDSGGQYSCGTTDITRTVAVGVPSREHIERFTDVLRGHIALARTVFPAGVSGGNIDVMARQYLWRSRLDYGHGTGHGVGSFLSVHEGPQAISRSNRVELLPGMVLSNEPGYYKAGEYGIRIENLMYVEECGAGFRRFQQLTRVPLDRSLIDPQMLSHEEIEYVNDYHSFVYGEVAPHVGEGVRAWLKLACAQL
ncbi:aminopeptidase P family protein [Anaplasma capra]|uniref:aminopeptidase P family protein n=1 Tax=Anaplasma capra TaxID=1562740 RepID=UPI0021D5ACAC|nr:aminopeptidase P family protein [Anaplasma capra]MCU7611529.1 aminopeptidase P family protein [Anaplasma capra]MCU7612032.1 aminopeptidase P family protein [Anaplasma capra]